MNQENSFIGNQEQQLGDNQNYTIPQIGAQFNGYNPYLVPVAIEEHDLRSSPPPPPPPPSSSSLSHIPSTTRRIANTRKRRAPINIDGNNHNSGIWIRIRRPQERSQDDGIDRDEPWHGIAACLCFPFQWLATGEEVTIQHNADADTGLDAADVGRRMDTEQPEAEISVQVQHGSQLGSVQPMLA